MKLTPCRYSGLWSNTGSSCAILLLGCISLLPASSRGADPAWWTARSAVTANAAQNPYAAVNQGQLKQFTAKAVAELNIDLASTTGGAGTALNDLVTGWQQDYATNGYATNTSNPTYPYKPADFQVVTVGQLKYIASLIYGSLYNAGYTDLYPTWIAVNASTDNAVANIGS